MAVKPEVQEAPDLLGPGTLEKSYDYLKKSDPVNYYYNKLKQENNPYLREDMWNEALRRGETPSLIYLLQERSKYKPGQTYTENLKDINAVELDQSGVDMLSKWEQYGNAGDYDGYMLALSMPTLDNTTKKPRVSDEGYEFGEFTDREWAAYVLENQFQKYDALITEERKNSQGFLHQVWNTFVSLGGNALLGVYNFVGDVLNIFEGLGNMVFNANNDDDIGARFLYAFANDPTGFEDALYEFHRDNLLIGGLEVVDPIKAYEDPSSGGLTTFGKYWNGVIESVGYMVPSIVLTYGLGAWAGVSAKAASAISTSVFYTGIFSGNIKDNVSRAALNDISYKDLNAGEVVINSALKATAQLVVEKLLGKFLGSTFVDKLVGTGTRGAAKGISDVTATGLKAFTQVAKRGLKDVLQEGLEEALQDLSDGIIDVIFGQFGTNLNQIYTERGSETISLQNLSDAFLMGALTSVIMGSLSSMKYIPSKNRGVGVDADGKAYSMGMFQTMNFVEAMQTMNEWQETLMNTATDQQTLQDTALKLKSATEAMSSLINEMGMDRFVKANDILSGVLDREARKKALLDKSDTEYATTIYNNFINDYSIIKEFHKPEKLLSKIKTAIKNKATELKDKKVGKINSIVTEGITPENSTLSLDTITKLKEIAKQYGCDVILGTDGAIITTSDEVMFVPDSYVQDGDIESIIQGETYVIVEDTVIKSLTNEQREMLTKVYSKLTGQSGTIEETIQALLFDKEFYAKALLLTAEKNSNDKGIEILITIDKIIEDKLATKNISGDIAKRAIDVLLTKVRNTLRAGIVSYATKYVDYDVNKLSDKLFPKEFKEAVKNHQNYIMTNFVKASTIKVKTNTLTEEDTSTYFQELNKYANELNLSEADITKLNKQFKTGSVNEKLEALSILVLGYKKFINTRTDNNLDKAILVKPIEGDKVLLDNYLNEMNKFIGIDLEDFKANKEIDITNLTPTAKSMILEDKLDLDNYNDRLTFCTKVLLDISKRTYTLGYNFTILKVLDKSSLLKKEYLTKDGNQAMKNTLARNKSIRVKDILNEPSKIDKTFQNIELVYDPLLKGGYTDGKVVYVGGQNLDITDIIMHELTHVTQDLIADKLDTSNLSGIGGDPERFESMLDLVERTKIEKYIKTNFPMMYTIISKLYGKAKAFSLSVYFMLDGELKANMNTNLLVDQLGFTFKNNRTLLVSPDGKNTWSLSLSDKESTIDILRTNLESNFSKMKKLVLNKLTAKHKAAGTKLLNELDEILKSLKGTPRLIWATKPAYYKTTKIYEQLADLIIASSPKQTIVKTDKKADISMTEEQITQTRAYIKSVEITGDEKTKISNEILNSTLYKGTNEQGITKFDNTVGDKKRVVDGAIWMTDNKYVAETYYNERSGKAALYDMNVTFTNPLVIDAKGATFSNMFPKGLSDFVAQVTRDDGYDALIIKNIIDVGGYLPSNRKEALKPSTDIVVFSNNNINNLNETVISDTKEVSRDILLPGEDKPTNVDTAKAFNAAFGQTRYISNKRAEQSNLKHFIKKGIPIQMHPGLADFIEGTTKDFDKLPIVIKDKIENGTLNKYDLLNYLATASNINDVTFKAIARYIFNNTAVENITPNDMKKLLEAIEELATTSYLITDINDTLTVKEIFNKQKTTWASLQDTKADTAKYSQALKSASTIKLGTDKVEAHADPSQLQIAFFRIYDGSLRSLRDLNNYGKVIAAMQDPESIDLSRFDTDVGITDTGKVKWNWVEAMKKADKIYQYTEIKKALDQLTTAEKIEALKNHLIDLATAKLKKKTDEGTATNEFKMKLAAEMQRRLEAIENLSDEEVDKMYLIQLSNESTYVSYDKKPIEGMAIPYSEQPRSQKNRKDHIRQLGAKITTRIAGLKSRYNSLPQEVKKHFDEKTYKLNKEYTKLSAEALETLISQFKEAANDLKLRLTKSDFEARVEREVKHRLAEMGKTIKPKTEVVTKTTIKRVTKIKNQEFNTISPVELTKNDNPDVMTSDKLVHTLLDTNWNKYSEEEVQGVETKDVKSISALEDFLIHNTDALLSADLASTEEAARWFLDSALVGKVTDEDYRQFLIIKQYYLEFILTQTKTGKLYQNMNANLKQQIDKWVTKNASLGGTTLAIHNNMLKIKDPLSVMKAADIVIEGVVITDELKNKLFDAVGSTNVTEISKTMREIIEYAETKKKRTNKSFTRKIVSIRSMSMLSGPLTWLRNSVSNVMLKNLNKLSSAIGNRMFKGKAQQRQIKLTAQVTTEIKTFIKTNFIDNEIFDKIISNVSKYNPSDIPTLYGSKNGVGTRDAILAQLVMKSMYNEYYNRNMFNTKFLNQLHQSLMKLMSDDNFVREATIRYFGKLLAENKRDLSKGITDDIMNDFAKAFGLASADYMHSENFFTKWEKILMDTNEAGWFLYKLILPFASSSWNWFKAMIKLSPLGLGKAIYDTIYLEKRITKVQQRWEEGKSQLSPELVEYITRRELGQGVIGTILYIVGIALASLGFIQLDEDDYGNPKLTIPGTGIKFDISSIFGSSSLLAGAAFVTGIKDEGSFVAALNRTLDVMLDNFPIMEILELDMYSDGSWDIIANSAESIALSFIPNFLSYLAGFTYTGNIKKDTFWKRAAAKIPFLANFVDKKVDPYTGSTGSVIDIINRVVPYLSIKVASDNERKTTELGLTKSMLRGQYDINGEEFNVKGKDLEYINTVYGKWNAEDLTKFYDNKMRVSVKVGNTYQTLSYNQMNDTQRKAAVQNIMSNNAELIKIVAWIRAGNKYYGSSTIYAKLKARGITQNVYIGTAGFVKKK